MTRTMFSASISAIGDETPDRMNRAGRVPAGTTVHSRFLIR